ncbi:ribulose-phosphate 3-epimerase [Candidatus Palibaumannia cicadellinicola]|uniref:Ribulose-phosphate 3-epimerase n=1 Tax=Candidatus Palibaumannia cicadellinicola TaxID=186490 RepID=A0A0K2BKC8_9GAMM|nr:ribulose-phosphate 3-epimerase [Candidatus Baumannia cicadellinicola]AKZ65649.1 Ribulose-phosphate 3-epimerase [Candidatus Baumannia cicadellinicola]
MKNFWIAPSILSADFACLGEDTARVVSAGADLVHFDVMDNHYVPNITIGPLVLTALRKYGINAPIDVHLMVKPVDNLIISFANAGANYISFHKEASEHIDSSLQLIKAHGCKAGLVFNPATSLECLEYVIDKIDMILLMSVNPGFSGQSFISSTIDKIRKVRKIINFYNREIRLEVDGGINIENIGTIAIAGADTFVAGSAIFSQKNYHTVINAMRNAISLVVGK